MNKVIDLTDLLDHMEAINLSLNTFKTVHDSDLERMKQQFNSVFIQLKSSISQLEERASSSAEEQTAHNRSVEGSNPPRPTNDLYPPICWNCQVPMTTTHIGVTLMHYAYNPPRPYVLQDSDIWTCPGCGYRIYGRFGDFIRDEAVIKRMAKLVDGPRRVYENMTMKRLSLARDGYGPGEDYDNLGRSKRR